VTLANAGIASKFDHVLDLAYGRKGKLRWELMNVREFSRQFIALNAHPPTRRLFFLTLTLQSPTASSLLLRSLAHLYTPRSWPHSSLLVSLTRRSRFRTRKSSGPRRYRCEQTPTRRKHVYWARSANDEKSTFSGDISPTRARECFLRFR